MLDPNERLPDYSGISGIMQHASALNVAVARNDAEAVYFCLASNDCFSMLSPSGRQGRNGVLHLPSDVSTAKEISWGERTC